MEPRTHGRSRVLLILFVVLALAVASYIYLDRTASGRVERMADESQQAGQEAAPPGQPN